MKKLLKSLIALIIIGSFQSCDNKAHDNSKIWLWMHADNSLSDKEWNGKFKAYASQGIDAILIGGDRKFIEKVLPIAHQNNLELHVWMWTLNRNGDTEAQKHPEWYSVNRLGSSCYDERPYVEYYQWVCPSIEAVQNHILNQVSNYLEIEGLDGIHLDYVRYSDAILPKGLWSKYDIVQDKVYPEWDYGYNQSNIKLFKDKYGYSPLDLEDPNTDENWVNFRLQTVTDLVNKIAELVHSKGKFLSAAVFPSPKMASQMVYQSWGDWNLDAALPMIYHNFYEEDLNWIGATTADGVNDLKGKFPIYTGLFLPDLNPQELKNAIEISKQSGAKGVGLFDANSFKVNHYNKFE
jgi:uncharacterized lipoprotein YddW (UPF0748 family)